MPNNNPIEEIVSAKIAEHEKNGTPYSIGDFYEDAEVEYADQLSHK